MKFSETLPGVKLGIVTLLVSIGSAFNFGYQFVIINPSQNAFIHFLKSSLLERYGLMLSLVQLENTWSVIIAVLYVGAIFGSLQIRFVSESFGRLKGIICSFLISTIAMWMSILSYFVNSIVLYAISRALLGLTFGVSVGLSSIYLTECSPKRCHGFMSMIIPIFIQLGTVVGSVLSMKYVFGTNNHWWVLYAVESVLTIVVTVPLLFVPESPSYLYHHGDVSDCREALAFFHACGPEGVDAEYSEMRDQIDREVKSVGIIEILTDRKALRGTLAGSVVTVTMAFSGIPVIGAFSVSILIDCGLDPYAASYGNVILTVISTLSTMASTFVMEHFGRRPLVLFSISAITLTNVTIFTLMEIFDHLQFPWIGFALAAAIAAFLIFFSTGLSPMVYLVTAELVGQRDRSAAQSWNTFVQMICRSLIVGLFLPLKNAVGVSFAYLALFVGPMVFALGIIYFYLPETENRLRDIQGAIADLPTLRRKRSQ